MWARRDGFVLMVAACAAAIALVFALWLAFPAPTTAADGECRYYEMGTPYRVVAPGPNGTDTSVLEVAWADAPAGAYSVDVEYAISVANNGSTRLVVGGVEQDRQGSHSNGMRALMAAVAFAGGQLDVGVFHLSEGSSVTYGILNDPRWSVRVLVCFMGTGGGGGTGPPGATGPAGPTGPPCASEGSPCPVEVIDVTGAALEWVQLAIFVVALGLGLVVLVVTWLAVQAWRR